MLPPVYETRAPAFHVDNTRSNPIRDAKPFQKPMACANCRAPANAACQQDDPRPVFGTPVRQNGTPTYLPVATATPSYHHVVSNAEIVRWPPISPSHATSRDCNACAACGCAFMTRNRMRSRRRDPHSISVRRLVPRRICCSLAVSQSPKNPGSTACRR
jgi:hypothetical protein